MPLDHFEKIIAVALNPAIDRVVEVPGFRVGGHQRGRRIARYPAGKAINVARAMAMLERPCTVTGFVGQFEADEYRQFLTAQGEQQRQPLISDRLVPVEGHTRENISVIDPHSADTDTHIVELGFTVSEADVARLQDVLREFAEPGNLVAFCGSLPEGLTPDQFSSLLRLCLDAGAAVAVDASGEALRAAAQLPLWLLKPNREELAELTGLTISNAQDEAAAANGLTSKIRWLLVSAGSEGATLYDAQGHRHATLDIGPEQVVGTVGCGDTLVGGFLAGWQAAADEADLRTRGTCALRRGVAAASHAATRLARKIDLTAVKAAEQDVLLAGDKP